MCAEDHVREVLFYSRHEISDTSTVQLEICRKQFVENTVLLLDSGRNICVSENKGCYYMKKEPAGANWK